MKLDLTTSSLTIVRLIAWLCHVVSTSSWVRPCYLLLLVNLSSFPTTQHMTTIWSLLFKLSPLLGQHRGRGRSVVVNGIRITHSMFIYHPSSRFAWLLDSESCLFRIHSVLFEVAETVVFNTALTRPGVTSLFFKRSDFLVIRWPGLWTQRFYCCRIGRVLDGLRSCDCAFFLLILAFGTASIWRLPPLRQQVLVFLFFFLSHPFWRNFLVWAFTVLRWWQIIWSLNPLTLCCPCLRFNKLLLVRWPYLCL